MDYTTSVFAHESNLKDPSKRDDLQKKLGVRSEGNKPVLFHIINALLSGGGLGAGVSSDKENLYNILITLWIIWKRTGSNVTKDTSATGLTQQKSGAGKNITTDFQETDLGKKNFDNFGKNKNFGFSGFDEPKEEKPQAKGGKSFSKIKSFNKNRKTSWFEQFKSPR